MVNRVTLIGRLGADPEIKITQEGKTIARFSIATDESYLDNDGNKIEITEWHRIVVFGKLAEIVKEYFEKGRLCFIEGKLRTRQWEDKKGNKKWTTEVIAKNIRLLDKKVKENSTNEEEKENLEELEDDCPF